jgi:hypothetical protein
VLPVRYKLGFYIPKTVFCIVLSGLLSAANDVPPPAAISGPSRRLLRVETSWNDPEIVRVKRRRYMTENQ